MKFLNILYKLSIALCLVFCLCGAWFFLISAKPAKASKPTPTVKGVAKTEKKRVVKKTKKEEPDQPVGYLRPQTVIIDSGHGGKDYGALSEGYGYEEKQLTLSTSHMVKNYLQKLGYKVVMTRNQDVFLSLDERAEIANKLPADLFISIHFNFSPNTSAEGIEVYYCTLATESSDNEKKRLKISKELAQEMLTRTVKHTGAHSRGVKTANFAVLRKTEMPAVLIECGFLSNHAERERIKDPRYLNFLAWGIARAVDFHLTSHF